LRAFLPKKDTKGKHIAEDEGKEWELFMRLLNEANVYLAPGVIYHSVIPGFFRLTFTLRREYLKVGMERIEGMLKMIQKENEGN
jgi:1-aminocyclopropane-1-carboxylate synthase